MTGLLGGLLLIGGLVAGGILWFVGEQRYDDTVTGLARAPVGCDTSLLFDETGTFVVFVETSGTLDRLEGTCEVPGTYARVSAELPVVQVEIVGPDGGAVELGPADVDDYDAEGFAGSPLGEISVTQTGSHIVRVTSDESDFVVAVGRDPSATRDDFRRGALLALVGGVAIGAVLLIISGMASRRAHRIEPLPTGPPPQAPPPTTLPLPAAPGPTAELPTEPPVGTPGGSPAPIPVSDPQPTSPPSPSPWAERPGGFAAPPPPEPTGQPSAPSGPPSAPGATPPPGPAPTAPLPPPPPAPAPGAAPTPEPDADPFAAPPPPPADDDR